MVGCLIGPVLRLHTDEFEAEVADPVEQSVQLRLVFHFAGEHRVDGAGGEGHPFESHRQAFCQSAPNTEPVYRRLQFILPPSVY